MRPNEHWCNHVLLAAAVVGVGAGLIFGPLRPYFQETVSGANATATGIYFLVGIAYLAGFVITRLIDGAFSKAFTILAIYRADPEQDKKKRETVHKSVSTVLLVGGYFLFVAYAVFIAAALMMFGSWFGSIATRIAGAPS